MANNSVLSLKSDRANGSLADSHRELLTLVETHYERTGDPSLKEIVERAKAVAARR